MLIVLRCSSYTIVIFVLLLFNSKTMLFNSKTKFKKNQRKHVLTIVFSWEIPTLFIAKGISNLSLCKYMGIWLTLISHLFLPWSRSSWWVWRRRVQSSSAGIRSTILIPPQRSCGSQTPRGFTQICWPPVATTYEFGG